MNIKKIQGKANAAARRIKEQAEKKTLRAREDIQRQTAEKEAAAAAAKKAAGEAAITKAGTDAAAIGEKLTGQAAGISREQFGLGDEQRAAAAARRADIFAKQQTAMLGQQAAQKTQALSALQRRMQSAGIRGTGTAERLAQVAEKEIAGQSGQQMTGLKLGQSQQELAASEAEQQALRQFEQFREASQARAQELSTNLEASGISAERARQFSSDQAERGRAFQQDVVMKMQSEQFKERMAVGIDQFQQQMQQRQAEFDLDEEVTRFNMGLARAEANKKGLFGSIGQMGSNLWNGITGGGGTAGTIGATGGAVVGGTLGSLFGPVGTYAGATAGATIGGQIGGAIDRGF